MKEVANMSRLGLACTTLAVFVTVVSGFGARQMQETSAPPSAMTDPISGEWEGAWQEMGTKHPFRWHLRLEGEKVYEGKSRYPYGSWRNGRLTLSSDFGSRTESFVGTLQGSRLVGEVEVKTEMYETTGKWEAVRVRALSPAELASERTDAAKSPEQASAKEQTQKEEIKERKDRVSVGNGSGKLEGRVFRSDTNASATGVDVELVDRGSPKENQAIAMATTGPKGNFSFTGVRPGTYSMVVTARYHFQRELPCVPSGMLALTRDRWIVAVARTASGGFVEIVTVERFPVAESAAVEKNVDLKWGE